MRPLVQRALLVASLTLAAGCSSPSGPGDAAMGGDGAVDAVEAGGNEAGGNEAGNDAGRDANSDAGRDASPDATLDAGNDAAADTGLPDPRARPAHVGVDDARARVVPGYLSRRVYVAADGDDTRSIEQAGDPSTPWRTVERVNAAMGELGAGDGVLFRRGDTFRGTLRIDAAGSATAPLFFGEYGSAGGMPVISGADPVSGFGDYRDGIMVANVPATVLRVFVDGREMPPARSPNVGLFRNDSSGTDHVSAPGLGATDWSGATVWVRTDAWRRESRRVASQSGDALYFDSPTAGPIESGAGFVVEGALGALDDPGEWFYDAAAGALYLRFPAGADPASARVEATTRVHSIALSETANASNVEIRGLELAGSASEALVQEGFATSNVHVTDCVLRSSEVGMRFGGYTDGTVIEQCEFLGSVNEAAVFTGATNSAFRRNAVLDQMMDSQRGMSAGTGFGSGSTDDAMEENYFARSGFVALNNTIATRVSIRRNVVVDAMQLLSDGGAIYSFGAEANAQQIADNVVVGAPGSGVGAANGYDMAYGIYLDNAAVDPTVAHNLVLESHGGIFFNTNGSGFVCDDNAVLGGTSGIQFNTTGREAMRNLLVALDADAVGILLDAGVGIHANELGVLDANVFRDPFAERVVRMGAMVWTLDGWRTDSGQDASSRFDGTAWPTGTSAADNIRVVANTSLAAHSFELGAGPWVDLRTGTTAGTTVTLDPFAWAVLEKR